MKSWTPDTQILGLSNIKGPTQAKEVRVEHGSEFRMILDHNGVV